MSLDIGAAVRDGASRLTTQSALLIVFAFFLVGLASTVVTQSLTVAIQESLLRVAEANTAELDPAQVETLREQVQQAREGSPFAVGMPVSLAAALGLVTAIVAEAITLVAIRVFVGDVTGRIPGSLIRRNLPLATLNGFVGGIVAGVLVALGLIALVLPGIFFYVSFLFVRQEIAIEDENFIEALAGAWELSRGNRFDLFGLAVVVVLVSVLAFVPGLAFAGVSPVAGTAVASVVSPLVTVFGVAVTSRAYVQLKSPTDEGSAEQEPEDEYAGALGPDDIPEP
jgi:hypothetical protein